MGRIRVDQLADTINAGLKAYVDLATNDMKAAVQRAGKTVRKEIEATAPRDTGEYAKSWRVKPVKETHTTLTVVVHSPKHYQRAHLLEFGHAKRGGGRVSAIPHIAPAEAKGKQQLEDEIERSLRNG